MSYFGTKTLSDQWKAIYKSRAGGTGMSAAMRAADARLNTPTKYTTTAFMKVIKTKARAETMETNFKTTHAEIQRLKNSFAKWTEDETDFLTHLLSELEILEKHWKLEKAKLP